MPHVVALLALKVDLSTTFAVVYPTVRRKKLSDKDLQITVPEGGKPPLEYFMLVANLDVDIYIACSRYWNCHSSAVNFAGYVAQGYCDQ
ncbi:MAG: hypothetical protein HNEKOMLI_00871 [Sodalis sp. Psp]|nr:hypothetical protein [Sodalis sp. Psp]MCR3757330.1 hypothetical protein [Sodalis sp. Ppy]